MNMKKVFRKVAKQHGISVAQMKREMQAAIDEAYKNPSFHAECVHRAGAVPTPEEFVAHMARRLKGTHGSDK